MEDNIIRINDPVQEHFEEIANEIDTYSESDQAFILWYLLRDYIEDAKKRLKSDNIEDYESVKEYALDEMAREHIKVGNQIREVLFYEWS